MMLMEYVPAYLKPCGPVLQVFSEHRQPTEDNQNRSSSETA